jgi:hypothetical protein
VSITIHITAPTDSVARIVADVTPMRDTPPAVIPARSGCRITTDEALAARITRETDMRGWGHHMVTPDYVDTYPVPDHSHACRDCDAPIDAGIACTTDAKGDCDWPGGNEGCDCEEVIADDDPAYA